LFRFSARKSLMSKELLLLSKGDLETVKRVRDSQRAKSTALPAINPYIEESFASLMGHGNEGKKKKQIKQPVYKKIERVIKEEKNDIKEVKPKHRRQTLS
jgi:hypothetical protein